jgi:hypothetical protein
VQKSKKSDGDGLMAVLGEGVALLSGQIFDTNDARDDEAPPPEPKNKEVKKAEPKGGDERETKPVRVEHIFKPADPPKQRAATAAPKKKRKAAEDGDDDELELDDGDDEAA